jgi:hypothetical protein
MLVYLAVALVFLVAACGGELGAERVTEVRTVDASEREPRSPAARTVHEFWEHLASGSILTALDTYHPRVVASVGEETLSGALDLERHITLAYPLRVTSEEKQGTGTLVLVELPAKGQPAKKGSFLLRKDRIVYDSFTADALANHVQQRVQRLIDPEAEEPSARAVAKGQEALQRFRRAARASL